MNTEMNNLEALKDRNPFRVPDGYFANFTADMMNRLPDKPLAEPKVISFYDRVQPWLYMAAAFAGIIILFNVFNPSEKISNEPANNSIVAGITDETSENEEFMEYIEGMYADKYALSYIDDYLNN
ncbi:MAG: hypothetical protein LBR18_05935 [Tannerella sp.]|jgi:hypothetical protein|nr:hypothetical protein [Tannerella sp.]